MYVLSMCNTCDVFLVSRAIGNSSARIIRKSISTLSLGCSHGYGFPDGSSQKTVPLGIDCPSLNDWSQALGSHDTCYGE